MQVPAIGEHVLPPGPEEEGGERAAKAHQTQEEAASRSAARRARPMAACCIQVPTREVPWPKKKSRKLRCFRARNTHHSFRTIGILPHLRGGVDSDYCAIPRCWGRACRSFLLAAGGQAARSPQADVAQGVQLLQANQAGVGHRRAGKLKRPSMANDSRRRLRPLSVTAVSDRSRKSSPASGFRRTNPASVIGVPASFSHFTRPARPAPRRSGTGFRWPPRFCRGECTSSTTGSHCCLFAPASCRSPPLHNIRRSPRA